MMYVEQPVGTGFSHGTAPNNETDVARDFVAFLTNFLTVFDDYELIYLVGESYAGYYTPSIARQIVIENKQRRSNTGNTKPTIPLAGMALGNGWVDARIQGPATIDYGYWHGMMDLQTRDALHAAWHACFYDNNHPIKPFHSFTTVDDCAMMEGVLEAAGRGVWDLRPFGPNEYDVTTWDHYDVIQEGDTSINRIMNDPRTKQALHAPADTEWAGCVPGAGRRRRRLAMLGTDAPISVVPYIAELLENNIRVLLYNGDRDLSTCTQGTEQVCACQLFVSIELLF
jgi:carboxypeptidase D